MRVHPTGYDPTSEASLVCRDDWRVPAVMLAICWGIVAFWHFLGIWFIAWAWGAVCLLLTPLMVGDLIGKRRQENWVLALATDRLWVNLREAKAHEAAPGDSVVELPYRELRGLREYVHKWERPGGDGTVLQKDRYLELFLDETVADTIAELIAVERAVDIPKRSYFRGSVTVGHGGRNGSLVDVLEPGVLRIAAMKRGVRLRPGVKRVTRLLRERAPQLDAARREDPTPRLMDDDAFDDRITELLSEGDKFSAAKLLAERHGLSLTDAMRRAESWPAVFAER